MLDNGPLQGHVIVAMTMRNRIAGDYQVSDGRLADATRPDRWLVYPSTPVWAAAASGLAFLIQKYPALKWSTTCVAVVAGSNFFASLNVKTVGASVGTGAMLITTTAVMAKMQIGFEAALKDSSEALQSVRDRKAKVANFDLLTEYTDKPRTMLTSLHQIPL